MEILFGLLLLLVTTRLFGAAAVRARLPVSVGELLAGVALAAGFLALGDRFPDLSGIGQSAELAMVAQAGIFFLVLQAGIDMKPMDIAKSSKSSLLVAMGGALVPLAAGTALGLAVLPESDAKVAQSFFIGVVLSITSIPATVKVLREQGVLTTRFGQTIVAAAIFDDIIGLFLLAILTTLIKSGAAPDAPELLRISGKVMLFFVVTILLGVHVYPKVSARLQSLQLASAEFSILMVVALAYGLLAEILGLHWIMGAFMAGIFFEPERVGHRAYNEMRIVVVGITGGVLGPLFFASIGMQMDFSALLSAPLLVAMTFAVGFAGKFSGASLMARLDGFASRHSAAIGVGMSARGAVELVVISIVIDAGLFATGSQAIISALITTTLLSTLATSLLLPKILGGEQSP